MMTCLFNGWFANIIIAPSKRCADHQSLRWVSCAAAPEDRIKVRLGPILLKIPMSRLEGSDRRSTFR